ncbi:MAG: PAS domain S-box protein [Planctomycetia bacterium]|nr:PAS domain S-box protein [Planctomycetia bacterium]
MGPLVLLHTVLIGFFAFAAFYHLMLWWQAKRDRLLAAFSINCFLHAIFCYVLVGIMQTASIDVANSLQQSRLFIAILLLLTWLWCMVYLTGVRPRWFVDPVSIFLLILGLIHTLLVPINPAVKSVESFTLPWNEVIHTPQLGSPGWWIILHYVIIVVMDGFVLYCSYLYSRKDRLAGNLLILSTSGIILLHLLDLVRSTGLITFPYIGVFVHLLFVLVIAYVIARRNQQVRVQLIANEERLRTLSEQAMDGIFIADTRGNYVDVNMAGAEMLGYTREEILSKNITDLVTAEEMERVAPELQQLMAGLPTRQEWHFRCKDGSTLIGEVNARMLPDGRVLGVLRDTTERSRSEAALRESEEWLRLTNESASIGTYDIDLITGKARYSPVMCGILGIPGGTVYHRSEAMKFFHPEDMDKMVKLIQSSEEPGSDGAIHSEHRIIRPNGEVRWLAWSGRTLFDEGKPVRAIGASMDITDRKQAEETIRQIVEGIAPTTGRNFFVTLANHLCRACRVDYALIGAIDPGSPRQVRTLASSHRGEIIDNITYQLAHTPCESITRGDLCHFPNGVARVYPQDKMLADLKIDSYMGIPLKSNSGQVLGLIALLHHAPLHQPQQAETILRVVAARATAELERELSETARNEAERAMHEQEAFLRMAQEAAHIGSWEWDVRTNLFKWSSELARMHGIKLSEFDGTLSMVKSFVHPDDIAVLEKTLSVVPTGGQVNPFDFRIRQRTGNIRDLWVLSKIYRDEQGNPSRVIGVAIDITERKLAEAKQRQLEAQLAQAQKMETIGRLAGGVAHDFNNLLTVINGYNELLRTMTPSDDSRSTMLEVIHDAGERAAALTRQLLTFSRQQVVEPRVLDLNTVVSDTDKLLRRLIGEDVRLVTRLAQQLSPVHADPGQIGQVIVNLAVNSRDAMPQGGQLTLETSNVTVDTALADQHRGVKPGSFVMLSVTDTGSGMSAEIQSKIFEPFFTTKGPGRGTGLGLATVRTIAEEGGGFITVSSAPGKGSTFRLYLPVVDVREAPPARQRKDAALPRGRETILLVEDEEAVRTVTRKILQQAGYQVVEAVGGLEALKLSEDYQGRIDMLVTDVVMPGLGGRELVAKLSEQRRSLKVLFLSGYTADALFRDDVQQADIAFLQKPFTLSSLTRKVREVLDDHVKQPAASGAGSAQPDGLQTQLS